MAPRAAGPPFAPSAEVVGNAFVEQYYKILHHSPEIVYKFYNDCSVLSRPDDNGVMTSVTTMESIDDMICSMEYKKWRAEIKTADAQASYNGGVIVLVTGSLTGRDNCIRAFTQTFFLAPQEKGYFVLNDMLRYVEVCEPDQNVPATTGIGSSSTSPTDDQEPAHVITPKKWDQEISREVAQDGKKNVHELSEEERPLNDQEDTVFEADSDLNDKHYPADLESRISDPEDAPKKSYASIVSSETRKGTVKVYVPAGTSKATPVKTEKEADLAAKLSAQAAELLPPSATSSIASEGKVSEDEAEGYSIYIRNLPPRLTASQLESEFQKFGPIKKNGVQVRNNRQHGFCFGFVEFEDPSSMQSAIQASPITIGNHEVVIEMKRTTRRVVGGRGGPFSGGRGILRADSFRPRGSFGGGGGSSYGYMRSDFADHVDFSMQAMSEGYQPGRGGERARGRGGRRGGGGRYSAV